MLGLQPPTAGTIRYAGADAPARRAGLKAYRRQVQFVLQDPTASLNPKHTVYEAVAEGVRIHQLPGDERERVATAMAPGRAAPRRRRSSASSRRSSPAASGSGW